jgi:hypothetical protein
MGNVRTQNRTYQTEGLDNLAFAQPRKRSELVHFTLEGSPSKLRLGGDFPRLDASVRWEDAGVLPATRHPLRFDFRRARLLVA